MSETPAAAVDKRAWAQGVLTDVLKLLEIPAKLELKDAPDNGIAVAVMLEGEVAGLPAGKRSSLLDALQFLSNKIVNRPNTERRWISIGIGGFPEPRPAAQPRPAPVAPVPAPAQTKAPVAAKTEPRQAPVQEQDERSAKVPPQPELSAVGKKLAEKSVQFGRHFAVVTMALPERANLVQGADAVAGLKVKAEGEGRNRRVVFTPDKPTPMPKRAFPVDDEDELEE